MKVGDLVMMPGQTLRHGEKPSTGIVIELPFVGPNGERQQHPRVGILWSDGDGVDWEPKAWLEVVNESG
ncbi:hypothetical protein CMI47_14350 [Candidatus Pacearchaeota archaeon]|nr:hypothetical protein [Candidatus Pacearchaeota archaeon]